MEELQREVQALREEVRLLKVQLELAFRSTGFSTDWRVAGTQAPVVLKQSGKAPQGE